MKWAVSTLEPLRPKITHSISQIASCRKSVIVPKSNLDLLNFEVAPVRSGATSGGDGPLGLSLAAAAAPAAPRIALYSHDTLGLGHMRRNMLLAQTLTASSLQPVTLSIVGKPEACRFPLPARGERVVLPALRKVPDGGYQPASFDLPLTQVVDMRSRIIRGTLEGFRPDLLIVDNVPRGAMRELDNALGMLRADTSTRVVLGLRDVLDDPESIRRQWSKSDSYAALRDFYDEIWIYGDPLIFDTQHDYGFPADVQPKIRYTGYFDLSERARHAEPEDVRAADLLNIREHDTVLCLLGGGEDGNVLADAFADIVLPDGFHALIVPGPYLHAESMRKLERRAAADPAFRLIPFVREPMVLARDCTCVVAMGGFNTVWEIVALGKPFLVMPRASGRQEQWIRARRLQELGVLDVQSQELMNGWSLSQWVAAQGRAPRANIRDRIRLDGLSTVVELASAMLSRELRAVNV